MTDRFKFRAWDQRLKKIVYPDVLAHNINLGLLIQKAFDFTTGDLYYPFHDDLVLMQCTGLKDSEGRLIFEGDIVEIHNGYNIKIALGTHTVVFRGIGFWFVDGENDGFVFTNPSYIIKVIGNIYENPQNNN